MRRYRNGPLPEAPASVYVDALSWYLAAVKLCELWSGTRATVSFAQHESSYGVIQEGCPAFALPGAAADRIRTLGVLHGDVGLQRLGLDLLEMVSTTGANPQGSREDLAESVREVKRFLDSRRPGWAKVTHDRPTAPASQQGRAGGAAPTPRFSDQVCCERRLPVGATVCPVCEEPVRRTNPGPIYGSFPSRPSVQPLPPHLTLDEIAVLMPLETIDEKGASFDWSKPYGIRVYRTHREGLIAVTVSLWNGRYWEDVESYSPEDPTYTGLGTRARGRR